MKIEVELSEIENLRSANKRQAEEIKVLQKQLEDVSIKEMEKKAIRLAHLLFEKYIKATFKHLGFEVDDVGVVDFGDVNHWLGKSWYDKEQLSVRLRAVLTDKIMYAYLEMGIDKNRLKEQKEDNLLMMV